MNRWNKDTFDRLGEEYIHYACPDHSHPLCHACIETLENVVRSDFITVDILSSCLISSLNTGNIEKIRIILDSNKLPDTRIVDIVSDVQNTYTIGHCKRLLPPHIWKEVSISPDILRQVSNIVSFVEKVRDTGDEELISIVGMICPANMQTLEILRSRTPVAWAARIKKCDSILSKAISHKVAPRVLDVLVDRGVVDVTYSDIVSLLREYPPSIDRENVYYRMLSVMHISEEEFLRSHICQRSRMMEMLSTKCHQCQSYINDTNLYGIPISDIPSLFIVESRIGDAEAVYALDVREIIRLIDGRNGNGKNNKDNTYIHPYTREKVNGDDIVMTYSLIIEKDIPTRDITSTYEHECNRYDLTRVVEDSNLEDYSMNILSMIIQHGPSVLYTLKYYPNVARMYEESLYHTIMTLYPQLSDIIKDII